MMEFADKVMKSAIINIFHVFKKVKKKRPQMMEGMKNSHGSSRGDLKQKTHRTGFIAD